jgi:hypothetical protein
MNWREFSFVNADGIKNTYIEITNEDGSLTTFEKSESNSAYIDWKAQAEDLNGSVDGETL